MKKNKEKSKDRKADRSKNNFEILDFAKIMKGQASNYNNNLQKDKISSMDKVITNKKDKLKPQKLQILEDFNLNPSDISNKKSNSNSRHLEILNFDELKGNSNQAPNKTNSKKTDKKGGEKGKNNLIKDERVQINPELITIKTLSSKEENVNKNQKILEKKKLNEDVEYISFKTDNSRKESSNRDMDIIDDYAGDKIKKNNKKNFDFENNKKLKNTEFNLNNKASENLNKEVDLGKINSKLAKLKNDSKEKLNKKLDFSEQDDIKIENAIDILDKNDKGSGSKLSLSHNNNSNNQGNDYKYKNNEKSNKGFNFNEFRKLSENSSVADKNEDANRKDNQNAFDPSKNNNWGITVNKSYDNIETKDMQKASDPKNPKEDKIKSKNAFETIDLKLEKDKKYKKLDNREKPEINELGKEKMLFEDLEGNNKNKNKENIQFKDYFSNDNKQENKGMNNDYLNINNNGVKKVNIKIEEKDPINQGNTNNKEKDLKEYKNKNENKEESDIRLITNSPRKLSQDSSKNPENNKNNDKNNQILIRLKKQESKEKKLLKAEHRKMSKDLDEPSRISDISALNKSNNSSLKKIITETNNEINNFSRRSRARRSEENSYSESSGRQRLENSFKINLQREKTKASKKDNNIKNSENSENFEDFNEEYVIKDLKQGLPAGDLSEEYMQNIERIVEGKKHKIYGNNYIRKDKYQDDFLEENEEDLHESAEEKGDSGSDSNNKHENKHQEKEKDNRNRSFKIADYSDNSKNLNYSKQLNASKNISIGNQSKNFQNSENENESKIKKSKNTSVNQTLNLNKSNKGFSDSNQTNDDYTYNEESRVGVRYNDSDEESVKSEKVIEIKKQNFDFNDIMFPKYTPNEIKEAFDCFDLNLNGYISADEIKFIFGVLIEEIQNEEIDEMIKLADKEGHGQVSWENFLKFISGNLDAEIAENQRNEDFKDTKGKGFYKEMNMKENPIEIFGDSSSFQSDFSNVESRPKRKDNKSKISSKKKNQKRKLKNPTHLTKDLNVIEEEVKTGRYTYDDSLIKENQEKNENQFAKNEFKSFANEKKNRKNKKNDVSIASNKNKLNVSNIKNNNNNNNDKEFKDKFKNMLKIDDF